MLLKNEMTAEEAMAELRIIEAVGESEPPLDAVVDLEALALKVIGQLEELKLQAAQPAGSPLIAGGDDDPLASNHQPLTEVQPRGVDE